ncbi:MAG: prephenate dehydratase [Fimbriimonadaceae bacterium]|nr:prephenate dehydratase [Fimbriimonadaceae bacterium]
MSETSKRSLEQVRQEIDAIDEHLVKLLSRRTECAMEIGAIKGRDGRPFFTPERERAIQEKLMLINPGPLKGGQLVAVFREIISAARAAEQPLTAAFWGPPGTFSHMATLQTFGTSSNLLPVDSIEDVFLQVEHGLADYGVVPVENSLAGVVPETLDMFPQTNVKICAETYVPIHHHLATLAVSLEGVERVYAGPQPRQQCKRWLRGNLPNAELIEVVPTAKAAERAIQDPKGAAIVNKLGAETVGIPILVEHIEDNPQNRTRFLVVGYNEPAKTGKDKTSLMFNLRNRPGELYRALGALEQHQINLMMIESRPAQRASFEYIFYVDCTGHRSDANLAAGIETLKEFTLETTILGSYPHVDPMG